MYRTTIDNMIDFQHTLRTAGWSLYMLHSFWAWSTWVVHKSHIVFCTSFYSRYRNCCLMSHAFLVHHPTVEKICLKWLEWHFNHNFCVYSKNGQSSVKKRIAKFSSAGVCWWTMPSDNGTHKLHPTVSNVIIVLMSEPRQYPTMYLFPQ